MGTAVRSGSWVDAQKVCPRGSLTPAGRLVKNVSGPLI